MGRGASRHNPFLKPSSSHATDATTGEAPPRALQLKTFSRVRTRREQDKAVTWSPTKEGRSSSSPMSSAGGGGGRERDEDHAVDDADVREKDEAAR